jgi:hypothetical protein
MHNHVALLVASVAGKLSMRVSMPRIMGASFTVELPQQDTVWTYLGTIL